MDTLTEQLEQCYNLDAPLLFFPIRHHSPICSQHLETVMAEYQPDAILIEGPADSSHMVSLLGHPEGEAPLCLYYSYHHKQEEESWRSSCYYPLLDFSPELVAIRYGTKNKIPTEFIDLPYSELAYLEHHQPEEKEEGKNSYYDDYYLVHSQFIASLCEKQGCRHYNELWEKLFELGGLSMTAEEFIRSMRALCHYSRVEYPETMLQTEGCLLRETYMAAKIRNAQKTYGKILVITGGFHTAALEDLLQDEPELPPSLAGKGDVYLIPFSFSESDQLKGYASGMPYPAFYQKVSTYLKTEPDNGYQHAVLDFVVEVGRRIRKKGGTTSIADEIAAVNQAVGLAALREKVQPGLYELLDAVTSTYVKEAITQGSVTLLTEAIEVLRGNKIGKVPPEVEKIPLLMDFREQAKKNRLKVERSMHQDITLEILAKPAHRQTSVFLHRLQFLHIPFANMQFGPNYRNRDTSRVREKWEYTMSARVDSALVDVSYLGGTVREAASSMLAQTRGAESGCGVISKLLIDAAIMDLTEHIDPLLREMQAAVAEDGNLISLMQAIQNLIFLDNAKWLLHVEHLPFSEFILELIYTKALTLLSDIVTKEEDEDRTLALGLKDLYYVSQRPTMDENLFWEALSELLCQEKTPPCLLGSGVGFLYSQGKIKTSAVMAQAESFLYGSGETTKKAGRFLEGLFLSAWDILFDGGELLERLTQLLNVLTTDEFLVLLPDLRLAFSRFPPSQVDRLAKIIAETLGVSDTFTIAETMPDGSVELGRKLDAYARKEVNRLWIP